MTVYFLDTSAIVKRYFREQGYDWIQTLHNPVEGRELYISQIALVEVVASICRKAREQNIPVERRDTTISNFRRGVEKTYDVWLVDEAVLIAAGDLCRSYRLRSYDAVQLACAIAVREDALAVQRLEVKPSDFVFVSGDLKLLDIALAEGFRVEDPNNYS
jgi:predicted nucleic acid-binding protein